MNVNLNNPESIARWYWIFPERHGAYLAHVKETQPRFAESIAQASELATQQRLERVRLRQEAHRNALAGQSLGQAAGQSAAQAIDPAAAPVGPSVRLSSAHAPSEHE